MTNIEYNLSSKFLNYAKANPEKIAFVSPISYNKTTVLEEKITNFKDFHQLVANYREGLLASGHIKGDRIIILCPINLDFYAVMMATLSLGMAAVFLDPGIGLKKIMTAITDSKAKTIISVGKLLKFWPLIPGIWFKKRYCVDASIPGIRNFTDLNIQNSTLEFQAQELAKNDHVLITFTSGSTGRSKGADRNAENVYNQMQVIANNWACTEKEIDFPIFLMFGFMNLFYGITTVLPAADYKEIGNISPEVIISQMRKWKITRMSGSYTFNQKLIEYLLDTDQKIESIKNIVLGGTPVTKKFCADLEEVYPNSKNMMTYGSTEVAPISFCELTELISNDYQGSFVGRPCSELEVAAVKLPDEFMVFESTETKNFEVPIGEWGEIIIKGPHVVQKYLDNEKADKSNKISCPDGAVWHRTGDTGHFDKKGNLILTGRLSELIHIGDRVIQPYTIEGELDALAGIKRSALIQEGKKVILVLQEIKEGIMRENVLEILQQHKLDNLTIRAIGQIPLDDRHNSKINRIKLKKMVT